MKNKKKTAKTTRRTKEPNVNIRVFRSFPLHKGTESVELTTEIPMTQVGYTYLQLTNKINDIAKTKSPEYLEALQRIEDQERQERFVGEAMDIIMSVNDAIRG